MYNRVLIFKREFTYDGEPITDYVLKIDRKLYPCSFHSISDISLDLSKYDVVLCTSSLDSLETFILSLYNKKHRTYIENNLLEFLYYFWDSYTKKLSHELFKFVCTLRDVDEDL